MTLLEQEEIEALLVFHANGTLSAEDRAKVESAIARDPALADDLSLMQALRAEMQEEPLPSAGELAHQRLMAAVASTPQEQGSSLEQAAPVSGRRWPVAQLVAVLALVALVGQSFFTWRGAEAPGYELASSGVRGDLLVAFRPDATEEMIRETLLDLDLQIVSGPSSLGLYLLSTADLAVDAAAVAARSEVIESVENATE